MLKAARLLPAHRRLPHKAFLSGLWWKLLSLHPLRLVAYLPVLSCLRPRGQADAIHFTVNGFSAGSYTGAVIALALRCLWPTSQITARLGALAMPKGVLAALVATADPDSQFEGGPSPTSEPRGSLLSGWGECPWMGLSWPSDSAARAEVSCAHSRARPKMLTHVEAIE